ncbi:MAG: hydrogenase maturation protease [Anaerolineaceae bacterium]
MKISNSFWKKQLSLTIQKLKKNAIDPSFRVVILGIGNELRGDDAAGVLVARKLKRKFNNRTDILCIEGAEAPENFTSVIRRFAPDFVILVDAGALGLETGSIRWLSTEDISGGMGTHGLSLADFSLYLQHETGCQTGFLVIQARTNNFGDPINLTVKKAIQRVVFALSEQLKLLEVLE